MSNEDWVYFNGIDPDTGDYLIPPMTLAEVAERLLQRKVSEAERDASQRRANALKPVLGGNIDDKLDQVEGDKGGGWAVVFHKDEDQQVQSALECLISHRAKTVGAKRLKRLTYSGEPSADEWLKAHQVKLGDIEPWRVPRFLLIVGSPDEIPYEFSRGLPHDYAVGRLHFDQVEEYANYADSLIRYESGETDPRSKEAVFFRTSYDKQTRASALHLVAPLVDGVPEQADGEPARPAVAPSEGYAMRSIFDDKATFDALSSVFAPPAGSSRPALLFSATHGAGPGKSAPEQAAGAIICQDRAMFSGQTAAATENVDLHGLIVFLNACYSAGTPERDEFPMLLSKPAMPIVEKAFLAALPKALLGHPSGGALACIGHVEKAFTYAFLSTGSEHLIPYRNALIRILRGLPVGLALQDMRDRFVARNNDLTQLLYKVHAYGLNINDKVLVETWGQRNEAGGYILLGDPAAKLNVASLLPVAA